MLSVVLSRPQSETAARGWWHGQQCGSGCWREIYCSARRPAYESRFSSYVSSMRAWYEHGMSFMAATRAGRSDTGVAWS